MGLVLWNGQGSGHGSSQIESRGKLSFYLFENVNYKVWTPSSRTNCGTI